MTSGERMVWAMAYCRARDAGVEPDAAASVAGMRVGELGSILVDSKMLDDAERRMLRDMLGTGADR